MMNISNLETYFFIYVLQCPLSGDDHSVIRRRFFENLVLFWGTLQRRLRKIVIKKKKRKKKNNGVHWVFGVLSRERGKKHKAQLRNRKRRKKETVTNRHWLLHLVAITSTTKKSSFALGEETGMRHYQFFSFFTIRRRMMNRLFNLNSEGKRMGNRNFHRIEWILLDKFGHIKRDNHVYICVVCVYNDWNEHLVLCHSS